MIIRKAQEKDIEDFLRLSNYCFGDPYEDLEIHKKIFDMEATTVVEEDGKLTGGYIVYPFDITYGGGTAKMGGISCVVMDVDARYGGKSKKMLTHMIKQMHDDGIVFSALCPFNFEFYRKLGWESAYDRYMFEFDTALLEPYLESEYTVKKYYDIPIDEFSDVQTEYAKRYNGIVVRTKEYWRTFEKILKHGKFLFGSVSKDDSVCGYVLYKLESDHLFIREIVYKDTNALKALFGFIYRHNSQKKKVKLAAPLDFPIRLMVGDMYNVKGELQVLMMNRIVDVKKAFELGEYPNIGEHSLSIKVSDSAAAWNDGVWHLYLSQGSIKAEKGSAGDTFDATISMPELSRMLIGYAGGKELIELGNVEATTDEAKEFIEKVFAKKTTYMNNRF